MLRFRKPHGLKAVGNLSRFPQTPAADAGGGSAASPAFAFHPSPAQLRLAEGLQFASLDTDVTTLCRLSNVSRAAYYRWQRNPGYCFWLHQLCAGHLDAVRPLFLMRIANSALNGDRTAMRLVFPYLTNAPRSKADASAGFDRHRDRIERDCRQAPAECATTAGQEQSTLVSPLDQHLPEPGMLHVGPVQDAYRDFPSGRRPQPAPVTHPDYTPDAGGNLPPSSSAALPDATPEQVDVLIRRITGSVPHPDSSH